MSCQLHGVPFTCQLHGVYVGYMGDSTRIYKDDSTTWPKDSMALQHRLSRNTQPLDSRINKNEIQQGVYTEYPSARTYKDDPSARIYKDDPSVTTESTKTNPRSASTALRHSGNRLTKKNWSNKNKSTNIWKLSSEENKALDQGVHS